MRASEYLIDFAAHDGAGVVTLRVSTCGYVTKPTDDPANTVYDGCVVDPGTFQSSFRLCPTQPFHGKKCAASA